MLVAVTLGLDPSDYKDKTQLKGAMYAAHFTQRVAGPTPSFAGPIWNTCEYTNLVMFRGRPGIRTDVSGRGREP